MAFEERLSAESWEGEGAGVETTHQKLQTESWGYSQHGKPFQEAAIPV